MHGWSNTRPPIDPYLTSPLLQNPGGATVEYRPVVGVVDVESVLQQNAENVDELDVQFRRSLGHVDGRVVQHELVQRVAILRRVQVRPTNVEARL